MPISSTNTVQLIVYQLTSWAGKATLRSAFFFFRRKMMNNKVIVLPTSCSCGGNWAYFREEENGLYCIGCVCHTREDIPWTVEIAPVNLRAMLKK